MSALCTVTEYSGPGRLMLMPGRARGTPVLLTHGTFSTAETCEPLAHVLAEARDVYIIEWRGRGRTPGHFDFHDLAEEEVTQALRQIGKPVHLVAHSGGGLALCFALLNPDNRALTRSLTTIATQATHLTEAPLINYASIRGMEILGRALGRWPARVTGLGPSDESAALLSQWVAFNRARRASTRDGRDLYNLLAGLEMPALVLAGAADLTIARPDGCYALAQAFGDTAQYHLCSQDADGEDFTHTRLIRSRAAARSVWPRIAAFHRAHDVSFASSTNIP